MSSFADLAKSQPYLHCRFLNSHRDEFFLCNVCNDYQVTVTVPRIVYRVTVLEVRIAIANIDRGVATLPTRGFPASSPTSVTEYHSADLSRCTYKTSRETRLEVCSFPTVYRDGTRKEWFGRGILYPRPTPWLAICTHTLRTPDTS